MSTRLTELIAGTGCEQRRAGIGARDGQGKRDYGSDIGYRSTRSLL